jgi:hypothetical protein
MQSATWLFEVIQPELQVAADALFNALGFHLAQFSAASHAGDGLRQLVELQRPDPFVSGEFLDTAYHVAR